MKKLLAPFLLGSCLATALVVAPVQQAHAQASEFFDAFFSDNAGQPAQNFKGFIQWNVTDPANATNSSVDFVGGNVPGSFFYPTGRFVDLGGSTGQPALFSTKLPIVLALGTSYTLTYRIASTEAVLALGGPGANTLTTPTPDGPLDTARVTVGGRMFTLSTSSNTFQTFTLDFVATAATDVLALQDLGFVDPTTGVTRYDNSGVGLDLIAVTPQGVPAIPEPTTAAALALAMMCVGAAYARRQLRGCKCLRRCRSGLVRECGWSCGMQNADLGNRSPVDVTNTQWFPSVRVVSAVFRLSGALTENQSFLPCKPFIVWPVPWAGSASAWV